MARTWLVRVAAASLLTTGAAVVGLGCAHLIWSVGARDELADAERQVRAFAESGLDAADLSEPRREILLTVEDPDFFHHPGVDLSTPGAGLTTITQALSKRLFFDDFKPGLAKIRQTSLAFALDSRVSKEDQLTLFLHLAPLGHGPDGQWVTGFAAGARAFFGKDFEDLSDAEFTNLVARLIAPGDLSRPENADALADRVARIHRLVAGECSPKGLRDLRYAGCATGGQTRGGSRAAERDSR